MSRYLIVVVAVVLVCALMGIPFGEPVPHLLMRAALASVVGCFVHWRLENR